MYSEIDYYLMGPYMPPTLACTSPVLLECDIELVKKSLQLLIDALDKQTCLIPESKQLVEAINNYIKECNNAFLASEHIRNFLILGLFANLIVTCIVLASIPVTPLSISLVCFASLILFSINLFTLYQQMQGVDQEITRNTLTKCNKNFKEILNSKNLISNSIYKQEKVQSPTTTPCLFPAQKNLPNNDELKQNSDNKFLNNSENSSPARLNSY